MMIIVTPNLHNKDAATTGQSVAHSVFHRDFARQ